MRRLSFSRLLVSAMLVAGVALAQQGLIVEPWRRAAAPAAAAATATLARAMPASGLGPASLAPVALRVDPPMRGPTAKALKWSPPVVELLVDPWARGRRTAAAPAARPARPAQRWVPTSFGNAEIVDPWAGGSPKVAPLGARPPVAPTRSTIF